MTHFFFLYVKEKTDFSFKKTHVLYDHMCEYQHFRVVHTYVRIVCQNCLYIWQMDFLLCTVLWWLRNVFIFKVPSTYSVFCYTIMFILKIAIIDIGTCSSYNQIIIGLRKTKQSLWFISYMHLWVHTYVHPLYAIWNQWFFIDPYPCFKNTFLSTHHRNFLNWSKI